MTIPNELIRDMEGKIAGVNTQINEFQSYAEKLPRKVNNELDNIVTDLTQRKNKLEQKLVNIKGASKDAVADLEIGVQIAWEDLDMAYKSAQDRFKEGQS